MLEPSHFLSKAAPSCPADLLHKAQNLPSPRVAIAGAGAALPMAAAKDGFAAGIMQPIFVGDSDAIAREAAAIDFDISNFQIINASGEAEASAKAAALCGAGEADILMKGQVHTDSFMKAALARDAGLRTGGRLVHIFHISPPDGGRPILISDAAVNVAPDERTQQASAQAVVSALHKLGNTEPKIAFLSATESVIDSVPSSVNARALCDWAKAEITDAKFSGPLALDLILSPEAVATKGLTDDPVAGFADAVIVPDIVSGNALFKALVYVGGGCAAGVVMGAKVPILLTSRADPAAARLAAIALASVLKANP